MTDAQWAYVLAVDAWCDQQCEAEMERELEPEHGGWPAGGE